MWRVVSSTVLTAHRDPGRLRHAIINGYGLPRQANEPIEILTEGPGSISDRKPLAAE